MAKVYRHHRNSNPGTAFALRQLEAKHSKLKQLTKTIEKKSKDQK